MRGRVEVAGGGIAGLTTGLAFARKGWSVRVHEQDAQLRVPGAGIYIWENGLRVLETLGVLDAVSAGAIPASRHEKRDADGRPFAASGFAPDWRLIVPLRRTLLTVLADALVAAGGELVFDSRPVAALPEGRLLFEDGRSVTADLVVGADGINSRVRDSLGLLAWRRPVGQFGYRVMIPRLPAELETAVGRAHCENWNGSRRLLYAPCTAERAYVQLTSVRGDVRGNAVPIDRDLWLGLFPHLAWIIERIPDDGHSDWFELIRLRDWSKGRVAILGDAANAQPPFLGQGGGCAMMSALSLAHHVDAAGDVMRGIAAWTQQERRFTEWVQTVSYWYGQLAFLPPRLRTMAFRAVGASEALKARTLLVAARRVPTGSERLSRDAGRTATAAAVTPVSSPVSGRLHPTSADLKSLPARPGTPPLHSALGDAR
jgi:2-polyprenyl-6-methoxyphenol hydroxylase-like FAD-dependent oxidoreductase